MRQLLHVAALIVCSSSLAHSQTVADLARQERAKRENAPKAIVITNKDLRSPGSSPKAEEKPAEVSAPEAPKSAAPAPAAGPVTPTGPGGHDEKWWRGQFDKVREEIQKLETQMPLLESNFSTANREFLTRSYDPDGRGKRAIDESKNSLDKAKSDLGKARARLTQIEDDLRRAGGPAGWAR